MIKPTGIRKQLKYSKLKVKNNANPSGCEDEENFVTPVEFLSMMQEQGEKELEDSGVIIINDYISKQTLARAYRKLIVLHMDDTFKDDIQIILNSPGGYCDAGWAFIDMMAFVKNNIRTIAMGEIASMATSIFIAGDERIISPNTSSMIHQFSDYGEGNYTDLIAKNKMWDMEMEKDIQHILRCSKYKTAAEVKKNILKDSDHWLSPHDMKKHGLCDTIFKPKPRGKKKK